MAAASWLVDALVGTPYVAANTVCALSPWHLATRGAKGTRTRAWVHSAALGMSRGSLNGAAPHLFMLRDVAGRPAPHKPTVLRLR
jgi:hypothetical protein